MSTFDELTKGTSETAKRVGDFFTSIRVTFSPMPITPTGQTFIPTHATSQTQPSTTSSSFSRPTLRKRPSGSNSNAMPNSKKQKGLNLIVVVHLLPTLPEYLRALQKIGNIKVIIFKGPADADRPEHMKDMADWVENHAVFGRAVCGTTKDDLKKEENVIKLLSDAAGSHAEELLIMDIGGYFAPCLLTLSHPEKYKSQWKLLGIVEDTENGHQKYHKALEHFPMALTPDSNLKQPNIYSVARSQMKTTEDYNVGKSIVRAADSILRQSLDLRLEDYGVIGVLGFGKIGSSIATHLRQQHIGTVMIYDVNPAIMLRAFSHDFVICTKDEMLQKASIIFCATGNKSLTYNDLLLVGADINRLIIASCTSADDELDVHNGLRSHTNDNPNSYNFSRYTLKRLNGTSIQVILLCDGNAVNFYCRAVLGESIRSVQAAMMVCALKLQQAALKNEFKRGIQKLEDEDEMTIARLWLQHFPKLDVRLITNVSSAHTKYDVASVEEAVGDLPVDEVSIKELKEHLGLLRLGNTDSIDFMDSERKLIITASRGFGKTAVLFSLIHDIRNYYDLIWWFDCNDSLDNTLLSLAQEFHVSTVEISFDQLQKDVLKAVLSSLAVNNFLLIVDNVQELGSEKSFDVIASIVCPTEDLEDKVRKFKFHSFLSALDMAINDPSVRHQRRRHIVALYTDDNGNQSSATEPTLTQDDERTKDWLYTSLQEIEAAQAEKWIVGKLPPMLDLSIKEDREGLVQNILKVDSRRLTIRLTALFLSSPWISDDELSQINGAVAKEVLSKTPDILSHWIDLSLKKLEKENKHFFQCAQVASLIRSGGISCEVFHRLHDILLKDTNTGTTRQAFGDMDWKTLWPTLLRKLKQHCILKQNFLAPMIHTHVRRCFVPLEYAEVYSIPSTYVNALRTPLLKDKKSSIWKYALQLINKGFDYDYYCFNTVKTFQYEQNVVHYLDHATSLIKHTTDWTGSEPYAPLLSIILRRLGSYYLNERRIYSEASRLYAKAKTLLDEILNPSLDRNDSEAQRSSLLVLKWSATLLWHICEQLSSASDVEKDEEFVSKIDEARGQLQKIQNETNNILDEDKVRSRRYQLEAIIAVARIRVENARNENISEEKRTEGLQSAKKELEDIKNEDMGIRTHSLLLQILGSTYSILEEHEKAVQSLEESLKERERVLRPEHLDVARANYRLAFCLVQSIRTIRTMSEEECKKNVTEVNGKLKKAQDLCEAAFKIQKTQLSSDHRNLKDCNDLRRNIDELSEVMKSKTLLE